MKLLPVLVTALILLSACNFTLAADITPPPDYVPPSPQPTLGPLFPVQAPDIENGAAIYAEDCLPCHGETGLGDGPQGKQLPVTVAALGLPQTARKAAPARWFTVVSQGNLERFMPPFTSLSDQERWDVVAYALSLHTTEEQIQQGRELFESNCIDCDTRFFTDQETMAALSEDDLVNLIKEGGDGIPAFGANLSEEGLYAVAAYLRTLGFAAPPLAAPAPDTVTGTPPAAEATPLEAPGPGAVDDTPQAEATSEAVVPGTGTVIGTVENPADTRGASLGPGLTVTLRGFDHAQDSSGPQETLSLEGAVQSDGTFVFDDVELPEGRILLAEVTFQGITYQSEFSLVEAGASSLVLAPIKVYESSDDFTLLSFEQIHLAFDFGAAETVQIFEIYIFSNRTDRAITINTDGTDMPFIDLPDGAIDAGFEAGQDANPFVAAQSGFAILPSEETYSIIAFFTLPYDSKRTEIEQPFVVPAASALLFVPEGVKLQSGQLTASGVQQISNTNFETYTALDLQAGDVLTFTLSGRPKEEGAASFPGANQTLIFGAGALGLALILAGAWMYLRDRDQPKEPAGEEDDGFEDEQDVMDAIITLDDLHRAGKISAEAYQTRRAELKNRLKGML